MKKIKGVSDSKALEMVLNSGKFPRLTPFQASILFAVGKKHSNLSTKTKFNYSDHQEKILEKLYYNTDYINANSGRYHGPGGYTFTKLGVQFINAVKANKQALLDDKTHYKMHFEKPQKKKPMKRKIKKSNSALDSKSAPTAKRKSTSKKGSGIKKTKMIPADQCIPKKRNTPKLKPETKAKLSARMKKLNKFADEIQERSGSKTKTITKKVFNKSRKQALKEAGSKYRATSR